MGKFKKGNIPWNKGMKGIHLHPETEFKAGGKSEEHPSWKGGIHKMKKDCIYVHTGKANKRLRRPRLIYENIYGKIPKGFVIYHLDKNKHNDNLENLIAISRSTLLIMNKNNN